MVVAVIAVALVGYVASRPSAQRKPLPPEPAPGRIVEKPAAVNQPVEKQPEPVVPATRPTPPMKPPVAAERIADLLGGEIPGDQYQKVMGKIRELLTDRTANAVFIADLPTLTVRQMVVLWDVLWLTADFRKDGFGAFGDEFGREMTRRLAELLPTYRDAQQRHLVINMLLPDLKYLSDAELARLKTIAEADADEYVRKQAEKLKR